MPADETSIRAALAVRAKYLRRMRENRTPSERLAQLARLQRASFRVLCASPHGYQHYVRRNMALRRAEVIDGVWRPVSPVRRAQQP